MQNNRFFFNSKRRAFHYKPDRGLFCTKQVVFSNNRWDRFLFQTKELFLAKCGIFRTEQLRFDFYKVGDFLVQNRAY